MECKTVEFFIEEVRHHPCLWNMNHVSYRDLARKDLAWERVARKCAMSSGREAKIQWKKLRDSHREALRRRKPNAGPNALNLKPWKYEENMKFILTKTEKEPSYLSNEESLDNDTQDSGEYLMDDNVNAEVPVPEPEVPIRYPDPLLTDQNIERLEERYRERQESNTHVFETNRSDGLSKLFDSLCQKTRELPRYLQLRVQREIFDSICRAEEEALSLTPDSVNPYRSLPSSSSHRYNNTANVNRESQRDSEATDFERKYDRGNVDS